jgi:Tfp pilus assembly protein PilN
MRFNYLKDAPPAPVEHLRGLRIPREFRTPVAAIATAAIVVCAWSFLEHHWITEAAREEALATVRLEESREAFAATKLVRSDVDQLLALDGRLRRIRLSGSVLSHRLADIGNHVPAQAWLTSIARSSDGVELHGQAEGLNVLSDTIADLMSSKAAGAPTLVRAVRDDRSSSVLSFTIHAEELGR